MIELAARTRTLPPPPDVLWAALTDPRASGGRLWLELQEDEVEPVIVEGSRLTFTWLSPWPAPDGATLGRRRRRLNELFWVDLRHSFEQ